MVRYKVKNYSYYVWGDDKSLWANPDSYVSVEDESFYAEPTYKIKRSDLIEAPLEWNEAL
jgi:hypothetical protein